ncbi:hypothetical protein K438DRAFT_1189512 [Mycena galopus ATCC 62051]|nr:hypothetical protein K438DRAFT_1189512 [Mycena galopus ATCC 62051]
MYTDPRRSRTLRLLPFPSYFRFNPPSKLYLRLPVRCSYAVPVCSLAHALPEHIALRCLATSLTGSLPPPCHSTCPVLDVGEHIVAVVASPRFRARCGLVHGRRSLPASVLQVSNATSSSQPLVPSIDKQQRCLWATTFKYEILRRFDSALALEPSLCPPPAVGVHKRHECLARHQCICRKRVARAVRWRRDMRNRDDDVACSPPLACGLGT